MHRSRLTDVGVAKIKPTPGKQVDYHDSIQQRLFARVSYGGTRSWYVTYYTSGKPHIKKLGVFPAMGVALARQACRDFEMDPSGSLAKSGVGTFDEVSAEFLKMHVYGGEDGPLRSASDIKRQLGYAAKLLGHRKFLELGRGDYAQALNKIEEERGRGVRGQVYTSLHTLTHWYEGEANSYVPPLVSKMRKSKLKARERVLTDDEIRSLWAVEGQFADFCRVLLLSAQRRAKVQTMRWEDVSEEGLWTIATERGEKHNAGSLRLSPQALSLVRRQPRILTNPYVFASSRGTSHLNGFNSAMRQLRSKLPEGERDWVLHDLRRTARSLLSRAGVRGDISERVLGHAIQGVEAVYDRHEYNDEKADALKRLAGLIDNILNPTANVVPLRA